LVKPSSRQQLPQGLFTVHLRLPDIRFLLHYQEKVKQPLATRQAAALLGYRVAAIDQTGSPRFSLRFDTPVQSSGNLASGNSAGPKGLANSSILPLSG
jgi:hypothetical protein